MLFGSDFNVFLLPSLSPHKLCSGCESVQEAEASRSKRFHPTAGRRCVIMEDFLKHFCVNKFYVSRSHSVKCIKSASRCVPRWEKEKLLVFFISKILSVSATDYWPLSSYQGSLMATMCVIQRSINQIDHKVFFHSRAFDTDVLITKSIIKGMFVSDVVVLEWMMINRLSTTVSRSKENIGSKHKFSLQHTKRYLSNI